MATLATLRTQVLLNLDRSSAPATETSAVTDFINQVIREDICAEHNWSFMEHQEDVTSVASQEAYAFPDSGSGELFKDCRFIRVREGATNDFIEMEEVPLRALYDQYTEIVEGPPLVYTRKGSTFIVRAIPDSTDYTFRCHTFEYPVALSADGDSNDLTLYYARLVEYGTTARALMMYKEFGASREYAQAFYQERERAIRNDKIRLAPHNRVMKISTSAGRPALGVRKGIRGHRQANYSWWS